MDRLERARIAGAVSVLVDVERDPVRKTQLMNLMSSLQSNARLTSEEKSLIKEIDIFTTPYT
ncbi:MAG: hypothetical protein GXW85_08580 [Clostridia bacterium]|nr:hypothetical protein [Clostridia bacterium]